MGVLYMFSGPESTQAFKICIMYVEYYVCLLLFLEPQTILTCTPAKSITELVRGIHCL